jgi:hypothetical protein
VRALRSCCGSEEFIWLTDRRARIPRRDVRLA